METSPEITELLKAISQAQGEFEHASKSSINPHFKNKYADLSEVISTVKPILNKHGLCVVQAIGDDNGAPTLTTMLGHSSGQWMRSTTRMLVEKNTCQGVGSSVSYYRRYCLASILGISQADDDGQTASSRKGPESIITPPAVTASANTISPAQLVQILEYCPPKSEHANKILAAYKIKSLDQLPVGVFDYVLNRLKNPPEAK